MNFVRHARLRHTLIGLAIVAFSVGIALVSYHLSRPYTTWDDDESTISHYMKNTRLANGFDPEWFLALKPGDSIVNLESRLGEPFEEYGAGAGVTTRRYSRPIKESKDYVIFAMNILPNGTIESTGRSISD